MNALHDLLMHELQDLLSSAGYFKNILKRLASLATDPRLEEMFDTYYYQSEWQQKKLGEYLQHSGGSGENCMIARAIDDQARAFTRIKGSSAIRDIALLCAVNVIKHFEKTAIGTLQAHADQLKNEEVLELLDTLKRKIADENHEPLKLAKSLLDKAEKQEIESLLKNLLQLHWREEEALIPLAAQMDAEAGAEVLRKAIKTYLEEHQTLAGTIKISSRELAGGEELAEAGLMKSYRKEWEEHLAGIASSSLKDIALVFSIQRIQHYQLALFSFEELLSSALQKEVIHTFFRSCLEQERGNDQSFSAIAEGSLFSSGLNRQA